MQNNEIPQIDSRRRDLLRFATALTGLALMPRFAAAALASGDAGVSPVRVLRVGADGRLSQVANSPAIATAFRLRVRGADARTPLALDVRHGEHAHRCWQAWRQPDAGIAQSHATAVTCRADSGGLPLSVRVGGKDVACAVPALPGTYVLAIAASGALPAVEAFRLVEGAGDCPAGALQCRATSARADFSHVVLTVEPLLA